MDDLGGINKGADGQERFAYFHVGNLDRIKDAPPNVAATVHRHDVATMGELARCGFHLVDMTGEIWTMRRAG